MKIIKKTLKNSCVFACLESFLQDNGIEKTQDKMVREITSKEPALCSRDGVVQMGKICDISNELGLKCEKIKYSFPISDIYNKEKTLLIATTTRNGNHCVRYKENCVDDKNKILVMDPERYENIEDSKYIYYEEGKNFDKDTCEFYELKLGES